jgi:cysteine desulfurase
VDPLIRGGAQERGRRAGTENVPLAVGFSEAAKLMSASLESEHARLAALKTFLLEQCTGRIPGVLVNGHLTESLPGIVNISFDSGVIAIDGEALLFNLDLAGIAVTSGSACTSGRMKPSHVLLAMGRNADTAKATIRFSMGNSTTREDLQYAVDALAEIVGRIGKKVA